MTRFNLALLWLLSGSMGLADDRVEKLNPEHRKWLEEEVIYIITEAERDAFLSIESLEVRAGFIEAFWRRRDPNPGNTRERVQGRALPAARLREHRPRS